MFGVVSGEAVMACAFGTVICRRLRRVLTPGLESPLKRPGGCSGGLGPALKRPAYTKPRPPEGAWRVDVWWYGVNGGAGSV